MQADPEGTKVVLLCKQLDSSLSIVVETKIGGRGSSFVRIFWENTRSDWHKKSGYNRAEWYRKINLHLKFR
jgi:hypothetical protein